MYKLMIVEDEPLIRAGLKKYFDWNELGVHTIVEAVNGLEGIDTAFKERPDLIITDIRMPKMDGLEMIEKLRPVLPNTLFIILTGHNEFKYAQKAIHYGGVHDFLIKPLQYEESLSSIKGCIDKLNKKRREIHMRSALEQKHMKLKASEVVKQLLEESGTLHKESIQHLLNFTSTSHIYHVFVMTAMSYDISLAHQTRIWWRENAEMILSKTIDNTIHTDVNKQVLTYFHKTKLYAIVAYDTQKSQYIDQKVADKIQTALEKLIIAHKVTFFLSVSEEIDDFSKIGTTLQTTDNALYQRFFSPNHYFFIPNTTDQMKALYTELEQRDKQSILTYLENGKTLETKQLMVNLANNIPKTSPGQLFTFLQEVINFIRQFAHKNGMPIEDIYNENILNLTFVDDFYIIEDLFEWIASWMIHLSRNYVETHHIKNPEDLELFEQIEAFIRNHIDQDLTLNMIAEHFFYNPSYLSRLFKTKLNKNYMDFVKEIRIDIAQTHLNDSNYSVTDVCNICGYKSYKHFVKVFREITNMTPTEYRKQLRS